MNENETIPITTICHKSMIVVYKDFTQEKVVGIRTNDVVFIQAKWIPEFEYRIGTPHFTQTFDTQEKHEPIYHLRKLFQDVWCGTNYLKFDRAIYSRNGILYLLLPSQETVLNPSYVQSVEFEKHPVSKTYTIHCRVPHTTLTFHGLSDDSLSTFLNAISIVNEQQS